MGLLIKNGEIVTAADRFVADVYCDGPDRRHRENLEKRGAKDEVLDASGQFVLPGSSIRTCTWSCRSWAGLGRRLRDRHGVGIAAAPPASSTSASRPR